MRLQQHVPAIVPGPRRRWRTRTRAAALLAPAVAVAAVLAMPATAGASRDSTGFLIVDLGTLGGSHAVATQVNDRAVVVGTSTTELGDTHAFRWEARTGMADLGPYWQVGGGGIGAYSIAPPPQINNRGQVTVNVPGPDGLVEAAVWDPATGLHMLGTLGGSRSVASDINDRGQVAGWSDLLDGSTRAFLWSPKSGMRDLGTLHGGYSGPTDSWPCGYCSEVKALGTVSLNERGQVAGMSDGHAFRWDPRSGMTDLGSLGVDPWGQDFSFASDIDERGRVVGSSSWAGGGADWDYGPRAFLAEPGAAMVELGAFGWFSHATKVNDRGQVVGNSTVVSEYAFAGFLWRATTGLEQLVSGGWGEVSDINNRGRVVGYNVNWGDPHCQFVRDDAAGVRCLPGLSAGSSVFPSDPLDVNERGQIVGSSYGSDGAAHAVLWQPAR